LSAPGRRERRQAQRCRCDVVGQTSPFLGSERKKKQKKYITGITTGIEWKKKENLAGDAKGKLLGLESGEESGGKSGSFARRTGEPTGFSSRRKGGRDDATGLTDGEEGVPAVRGNDAAAVGSEKAGLEIERPEKVAGRVGERDSSRPSNEFGGVRGPSRREELNSAEFHNAVERADREVIPLWPPATARVTHGLVGGVLKQELDMIDAGGSRVDTVRVSGSEGVVDANEVPARASSAGRKIRDEEELIGAGSKGGSKGCRSRGGSWS
jgi:hypothetical protein